MSTTDVPVNDNPFRQLNDDTYQYRGCFLINTTQARPLGNLRVIIVLPNGLVEHSTDFEKAKDIVDMFMNSVSTGHVVFDSMKHRIKKVIREFLPDADVDRMIVEDYKHRYLYCHITDHHTMYVTESDVFVRFEFDDEVATLEEVAEYVRDCSFANELAGVLRKTFFPR